LQFLLLPLSLILTANVANHRYIGATGGLWHSPQTSVAEMCPSEFALL